MIINQQKTGSWAVEGESVPPAPRAGARTLHDPGQAHKSGRANIKVRLPSGMMTMLFECRYLQEEEETSVSVMVGQKPSFFAGTILPVTSKAWI